MYFVSNYLKSEITFPPTINNITSVIPNNTVHRAWKMLMDGFRNMKNKVAQMEQKNLHYIKKRSKKIIESEGKIEPLESKLSRVENELKNQQIGFQNFIDKAVHDMHDFFA